MGRLAYYLNSGNALELGRRELQESLLVSGDLVDPESFDVIHGGCHTDGAGDVRRAGLELVWQLVVSRLLERHRQDHVAAALPRGHGFEQLLATVENTDTGGAVDLVARERVELNTNGPDIDGGILYCLGSIPQHDRALRMGAVDDAF